MGQDDATDSFTQQWARTFGDAWNEPRAAQTAAVNARVPNFSRDGGLGLALSGAGPALLLWQQFTSPTEAVGAYLP